MQKDDAEVFRTFKERKALRKELSEIEKTVGNGWVSWTLSSRPHIIRLFTKVGAHPFIVTLNTDKEGHIIWFKKEIKNVR
jgi:hypothetical protein